MMLLVIIGLLPHRILAADDVRVTVLQKESPSAIQEGGAVGRKHLKNPVQTMKKFGAASAVAAGPIPSASVGEVIAVPKSPNEKIVPASETPLELKGVRG